jgi:hypothetical protein
MPTSLDLSQLFSDIFSLLVECVDTEIAFAALCFNAPRRWVSGGIAKKVSTTANLIV